MRAAVDAGSIVDKGGSAVDAVQRAVEILENDPSFNAGTGASLNCEGYVELDASIMEGTGLHAGAVCSLRRFSNPVNVARAVLDDGYHVFYAAEGAERFALEHGFSTIDPASLITERARERLAEALRSGRARSWAGGTVGAVARDRAGRVAAATSTGGLLAKRPGRVGDTPIIGAGTYADDRRGAVSMTGDGEGILRLVAAARTVDRLAGDTPADAVAAEVLEEMHRLTGATGGAIVVTAQGQFAWARTTKTMSFALACVGAEPVSGT